MIPLVHNALPIKGARIHREGIIVAEEKDVDVGAAGRAPVDFDCVVEWVEIRISADGALGRAMEATPAGVGASATVDGNHFAVDLVLAPAEGLGHAGIFKLTAWPRGFLGVAARAWVQSRCVLIPIGG